MALLLLSALPALARGNDWSINDGMGEQVQVRNPLFGKKVRVVKDRLGDGFAQQQSILGSKTTEVSLLGNRVQKKKGLFGNTETDASTIFGDKFVSKKGIFGRRQTAIDMSGSGQMIKSLFGHVASPNFVPYNPAMAPGAVPGNTAIAPTN